MNQVTNPLITFAVFTYNQETFIAAAVEAALAQDYQPLQVILSDDCSSDATYSLMKALVEEYEGPHRVELRRSEINLGTAAHVQAVAEIMKGELLVVAAGDDISLPSRTSQTVEAWRSTGHNASVLHGRLVEINPVTRNEVRRSAFRPGCDIELHLDWYLRHRSLPFFSPTCAYARRVFSNYPALIGGSVIEDGVLVQRCFLEGPVVPIKNFLILQRVGHDSVGRGFSVDNPWKWNRHLRSRTISALSRLQDLAAAPHVGARERQVLERDHLAKIRALPQFVLPLSKPLGLLGRVLLALKMVMSYPSSASFLGRVYFALRFARLSPSALEGLRARAKQWQEK